MFILWNILLWYLDAQWSLTHWCSWCVHNIWCFGNACILFPCFQFYRPDIPKEDKLTKQGNYRLFDFFSIGQLFVDDKSEKMKSLKLDFVYEKDRLPLFTTAALYQFTVSAYVNCTVTLGPLDTSRLQLDIAECTKLRKSAGDTLHVVPGTTHINKVMYPAAPNFTIRNYIIQVCT